MTAQSVPATTQPNSHYRLSFAGIMKSEWIKLLTLRSTVWAGAVTVLVMVGFALLTAWGMTTLMDSDPDLASRNFDADPAATAVVSGYAFAQIVVAVLAVLTFTGEYRTGQTRSTFSAVPTRIPVLVAKSLVIAITTFVLGVIGVALSALATWPILHGHDISLDLSNTEVLRQLVGAPLYLVGIALLALAIGALLRHSAGGIATILGLLILLPILGTIPLQFLQDIGPYLPATAGELIIHADGASDVLSPWAGYGVLWIYIAAALVGAGALLRWRDA